MTEPTSLWGSLPLEADMKPPIVFLKEQASILSKQTGGLLVGDVATQSATPALKAWLDIISPSLNGYRFRVLQIEHGLAFYPVTVVDLAAGSVSEANEEAGYVAALQRILSSPRVHKVVAALISQTKATTSDLPTDNQG